MGIIKKLPNDVISKVAAGEVIENPASIVKELIENSLDAEATHIDISLKDNGLKNITVIDNGHGMCSEDLKLSIERYATSKVQSVSDLSSVSSFGFRGEALYSIASVSDLTIKSRTAPALEGFVLDVDSNLNIKRFEPQGMPIGTQISVSNLFSTIPARLKFLKSASLELNAIIDVVLAYSLVYKNVKFTLSHNGKDVLNFSSVSNMDHRVSHVLGEEITKFLIPLELEADLLKITGYISKPQLRTSYKNNSYIFVNNRYIKSRTLNSEIKKAYGSLLDTHSYPTVVLYYDIPAEYVDVNIHPRKEEVAFWDTNKVLNLTSSSIIETLKKENLMFQGSIDLQSHGYSLGKDLHESYDILSNKLKSQSSGWSVKEKLISSEILQINNLYLIAQTTTGLVLLDQHAAHEKILYDEFTNIFQNLYANKDLVHDLANPLVFDLAPKYAILLKANLEFFSKLGFEIEEFGGDSFKVSKAPITFHNHNISRVILEILDDLLQEKSVASVDTITNKILSFLACRTAIKSGEYLTAFERKRLVEKVIDSENTYTCPHGRPVMIKLSMRDLDKMFKRI